MVTLEKYIKQSALLQHMMLQKYYCLINFQCSTLMIISGYDNFLLIKLASPQSDNNNVFQETPLMWRATILTPMLPSLTSNLEPLAPPMMVSLNILLFSRLCTFWSKGNTKK